MWFWVKAYISSALIITVLRDSIYPNSKPLRHLGVYLILQRRTRARNSQYLAVVHITKDEIGYATATPRHADLIYPFLFAKPLSQIFASQKIRGAGKIQIYNTVKPVINVGFN